MPCRSDYMEQTSVEKQRQQAIMLLIYVKKQIGEKPTDIELREVGNIYTNYDAATVDLCVLLKSLDRDIKKDLLSGSNELKQWWKSHCVQDVKRELKDALSSLFDLIDDFLM